MGFKSTTGLWQEAADDPGENPACERVAVLITRYIDGELSGADAHDLRQHLAGCPACRHALDAQSQQSRLLNESLRALWKIEDRAARKKKAVAANYSNILTNRYSKAIACAAMAACAFLYATTARLSVGGPKSNGPDKASPTAHITPIRAPEDVASEDTTQVVNARSEVIDGDGIPSASSDAIANAPAVQIVVEDVPPLAIETAKRAATVVTIPYAMLATPVPIKPIPGVELSYSAPGQNGVPEAGRVTLLGDVLNGKGIVRIETNRGETIDAAQTEMNAVLTESQRMAARKLLKACSDEINRKRIENAIETMREK